MTKVGLKLRDVLMQNFKPGTTLTNMELFAIARKVTASKKWQREAIKELVLTGYLKPISNFKFVWLGEEGICTNTLSTNSKGKDEICTNALNTKSVGDNGICTKGISTNSSNAKVISTKPVSANSEGSSGTDRICTKDVSANSEYRRYQTQDGICTNNNNPISTNSESQNVEDILSEICTKGISTKTLIEKLHPLLNKTRAKIFYCLTFKECYYREFINKFRIWQQSLDPALSILEHSGIIERTSGERVRRGRGRRPEKFFAISEEFKASPYFELALQLVHEVLSEEELRRIQTILNPSVARQSSAPPSEKEFKEAVEVVSRVMVNGGDFREAARIQASKFGIDEEALIEHARKRKQAFLRTIPGKPGREYLMRGKNLPI